MIHFLYPLVHCLLSLDMTSLLAVSPKRQRSAVAPLVGPRLDDVGVGVLASLEDGLGHILLIEL